MARSETDKKSMRILSRENRRNFPLTEKKRADKQIHDAVLSHASVQSAHRICVYVSLPDEVETNAIIDQLLKRGKTVSIPKVVSKGVLKLYEIHSFDDVITGAFGILEPDVSCTHIEKTDVDIFIVPGIAFDREGNRLGRGMGYYDRLLEGLSAYKIGLAYASQIISGLPHNEYDIPMDTVITERETIIVNRS